MSFAIGFFFFVNGLLTLLVEAVGSNETDGSDGSDQAVGLASSASNFDSSG